MFDDANALPIREVHVPCAELWFWGSRHAAHPFHALDRVTVPLDRAGRLELEALAIDGLWVFTLWLDGVPLSFELQRVAGSHDLN
ncbi:hypothetical protein JYT28_00455 [Desulfobulbus sp. AH-315-M07]|nr:hypothetical protein [Desulfobulbus sp. AH-315-M07]